MGVSSGIKDTVNTVIHRLPISDKAKAKWKIYRLVDRILFSEKDTKKAENDPEYKKKLIEQQEKKYPHKYMEIKSCAIKLAGNNEELILDMIFSYFAYGYTPNEFMCYDFRNKSLVERRTFLSDRDSVRYAYRLNPWDDMDLFMDKTKTYQKFQEYYGRTLFVFDNSDAIDETGRRYKFHPDTGVHFKGETLPEWENMLSICKKWHQN